MKIFYYTSGNSGYIALISSIVLSAVLALFSLSALVNSFYAHEQLADAENFYQAESLAQGCLAMAQFELAEGRLETGTVPIDSQSCLISKITMHAPQATQAEIETEADVGQTKVRLQSVIDMENFSIIKTAMIDSS